MQKSINQMTHLNVEVIIALLGIDQQKFEQWKIAIDLSKPTLIDIVCLQ
ncbi:hypothetical protein [Neobacillus endophyticus]|nr:hypothetical protein [Neobacillus endophyticus]